MLSCHLSLLLSLSLVSLNTWRGKRPLLLHPWRRDQFGKWCKEGGKGSHHQAYWKLPTSFWHQGCKQLSSTAKRSWKLLMMHKNTNSWDKVGAGKFGNPKRLGHYERSKEKRKFSLSIFTSTLSQLNIYSFSLSLSALTHPLSKATLPHKWPFALPLNPSSLHRLPLLLLPLSLPLSLPPRLSLHPIHKRTVTLFTLRIPHTMREGRESRATPNVHRSTSHIYPTGEIDRHF